MTEKAEVVGAEIEELRMAKAKYRKVEKAVVKEKKTEEKSAILSPELKEQH